MYFFEEQGMQELFGLWHKLFCRIAFYFILSGIKKITKHFCGFIDVSFLCINWKIAKVNLLDSIGMDYFGQDAVESIVIY